MQAASASTTPQLHPPIDVTSGRPVPDQIQAILAVRLGDLPRGQRAVISIPERNARTHRQHCSHCLMNKWYFELSAVHTRFRDRNKLMLLGIARAHHSLSIHLIQISQLGVGHETRLGMRCRIQRMRFNCRRPLRRRRRPGLTNGIAGCSELRITGRPQYFNQYFVFVLKMVVDICSATTSTFSDIAQGRRMETEVEEFLQRSIKDPLTHAPDVYVC